ncbi:hypothetical protein [Chengkuizengella axinellae]|uniref:Uncharacterized protein n=1 Tax=Chengkuizengella axinellae TaxID=3064388 RepID=A0ABT9J2V7_9BACL|nr:hypothetical protein [Chengkuizengella sp. 2205SS18-9]MDP5275951.1 hypothetical protein [Chengkuizengella sp. 2205SS18-9]
MQKLFRVGILLSILLLMPTTMIMGQEEEGVKVEINNENGGEARPDLDTVNVELIFSDIENGSANILLNSPERKFFSPTDFPIVEGTELIHSIISVENGKAAFDYMFPIRGDYPMTVEVLDENGTVSATHLLNIHIPENPDEVKNAIIFVGILVLFGFLVGLILTARRGRTHAI